METHIKGLKICKRIKRKYHPTQAQKRGPQPGKIGPKREEHKAKPKSNRVIFAGHMHGPTQEVQRRSPTEDGAQRPQLGCDRITKASFGPKLHRPPLTTFPWSV
jgi:hypothetical protein